MTDAVTAAGSTTASSTQSTSADKAAGGSATLGYSAFLQLLVAQTKNQDPMEPMKSSDYVAQLATFSEVEKSTQMSEQLGALITSSQLAQASGLVGRTITSADGATSGVVASSHIGSDGVVAVLADGQTVTVGAGVVVSGGAA